ncbi:Starch-binding associating with outer membrane [Pedobacter sp. ok626]|uniref:RagB/SusD family nutrient uptake outer membrane protein n=1 Tax=Pedobacter sp. ok626 TaxID=1761882 RepID=UPI000890920E|nr:RagB/SusD family nutrient uptake outer membrane protein [Pedobacter sp. ok626]SDJ90282.1 Starch-binding associating with outer membrane [Pedobacter sp. ok626]
MKKTLSLITICCLFSLGCGKNFIELNPITSGSTNDFYKTVQDITNAVNATYSSLQTASSSDYIVGDIPTDDSFADAASCLVGHCDFDLFNVIPVGTTSAGVLNTRWTALYKGISRANIVLSRIDPVAFGDQAVKNRLKGEVKFLRAYFYYSLVTTFGDVPLITKELQTPEETYEYGRAPKIKIYEQIETDLKEAFDLLPPTYAAADIGRATKWAAEGLLARVLMFQRKFSDAKPYLKDIIDKTTSLYGFLPNYSDVFRYNNGNNKEIIFAIQYTRGLSPSQGNAAHAYFAPTGNFVQPIGGAGYNVPTTDLYNEFEPGDARKNSTMALTITVGTTITSRPHVRKFLDQGIIQGFDTSVDFPVLRYSDILLMYAECQNETGATGDGVIYLNKVRTTVRTNLPPKLLTINQQDLRTAIEKERRIEFAFEGLHFFDLVRTNRLIPVMNAYFLKNEIKNQGVLVQIDDHNTVFPIPQQQIDTNPDKITQNTGY